MSFLEKSISVSSVELKEAQSAHVRTNFKISFKLEDKTNTFPIMLTVHFSVNTFMSVLCVILKEPFLVN